MAGSEYKEKPKPDKALATRRTLPAPYQGPPAFPLSSGWEPLRRFREEVDQMIDQYFRGWPSAGDGAGRSWGLEVREDDSRVLVRAEAPGFEPSDFDNQVRGDALLLRAAHETEKDEEQRLEWRQRELCQSVVLPAEVDAEKVEARYRNGVLTVTLPKTEQGKRRRIQVHG